LLWRHTWPEFERVIGAIEAHRPELREASAKRGYFYRQYARQLNEMISFPHPNRWTFCSLCKGKGHKGREKADCVSCGGGGFNSNVRGDVQHKGGGDRRQQDSPGSRHFDVHAIASEDGPRTPGRCGSQL
jgi:hypothetical protein